MRKPSHEPSCKLRVHESSTGLERISEMLLLLLPLFNSSSVKNLLRPFSKDRSSDAAADDSNCPICRAAPSIPFLTLPCHHRYCYYCLRTRCAATPSFRCYLQSTHCCHAATLMQTRAPKNDLSPQPASTKARVKWVHGKVFLFLF